MKEKLRITSLLKNTVFYGKAKIGGNWYVLTEDFHLLTASEFETNPLHKGERMLQIEFTPYRTFWEMEYEKESQPIVPHTRKADSDEENHLYEHIKAENELNRRKRIAVKEFFLRNNQLEHGSDFDNNFAPHGPFIARVDIMTQKGKVNHLNDRKKALVFHIIDQMSWPEQYDLMLYYAPELSGKRRSDVLHGLIGLKDVGTERAHLGGKMWQRLGNGKTTIADDFLNNYMNHQSQAIVMKIYVEKAVAMGLITKGNGGLYMNGGSSFIGKDSTDAVLYFTKDMQSYTNIIQSEVNKSGELPEDDLGEAQKIELPLQTVYEKNKQTSMSSAQFRDHYRILRDEYLDGGGSWPEKGMSYKELQERVEKQRLALDASKKKDELPTNELQREIDPSHTDDFKKLRAYANEIGVKYANNYKGVGPLKEAIKARELEMENEGLPK